MTIRTLCISLLAVSLSTGAAEVTDTLSMTERERLELIDPAKIFTDVYDNPVMTSVRRAYSLNSAGIGWNSSSSRSDQPSVPANGRGSNSGEFAAKSYIRNGNATLSGHAAYSTGKIKKISWCETSDYDIVYPYILADAVGGDMKKELYSFGGAVAITTDRLLYGGSISYDAGLYYRDVDPRPRNITGLLSLNGAIGFKFAGEIASLRVGVDKYKQTNSVEFMSEIGVEKLYHLTGLGTDYTRFAGIGESTYYTGWRYGGSLDLHPQVGKKGPVASLSIMRFTFDNILSDLNKLPMATVREMDYKAMVGWRGKRMGVSLFGEYLRRLGDENIFGDAASGCYPMIATLTLYAHNRAVAGASGFYSHEIGKRWTVTALVEGSYNHDNRVQSSASARSVVNNVDFKADATLSFMPGKSFLLELNALYGRRAPLKRSFVKPENNFEGLVNSATEEFEARSRAVNFANVNIAATIALPSNLALRTSVSAVTTTLSRGYSINVAMIF